MIPVPLLLLYGKKYLPYLIIGVIAVVFLWKIYDFIGDQREIVVRAEYAVRENEMRLQYQEALKKREKELDTFKRLVEEQSIKTAIKLGELQAESNRLAQALQTVKLTSTVEVPSENGTCPRTNLSGDFGVCFNAAITRTAEARAACEAAGVSGAVPAIN